jgi:hypothetical protein
MIMELFEYGIHNEASNIRAHVAPLACCVFVFPTICGVRAMKGKQKKFAYQPGVDYPTAEGALVKPREIANLRTIKIHPSRLEGFSEDLTTSEKGDKAVEIVQAMLKHGKFPLWFEGEFVKDVDVQTTGTDVIVQGKWKIEVKCDYRASTERGEPNKLCTGNLFLQTAERNPFRYV